MRGMMQIAGLLLGGIVAVCGRAQEYTAVEIGTLGGSYSQGLGISSNGEIAGGSLIADGHTVHAFRYSKGSLKDLGTLGGELGFATAINSSGVVVGFSRLPSGGPFHGFVYADGRMKDLGTLGGTVSNARGINAAGTIVGTASTSADIPSFPFVISNGEMQKLDVPVSEAHSVAFAINDLGDIVGGAGHAFLYSHGTAKDLGTLGGDSSTAYAINRSGDVVGTSLTTKERRPPKAQSHAFLYSGGTMKDLGTLGGPESTAWAINSAGVVVGDSSTSTQTYHHAFIYKNGVMRDLNDLSGSIPHKLLLRDATGINDAGEIVVNTVDSTGSLGPALLLKPKSAPH